MAPLRTLGMRLAVVGTIGGSVLGLFAMRRRRKLTARDVSEMDDDRFRAHLRQIGLADQVRDALLRIERDAA